MSKRSDFIVVVVVCTLLIFSLIVYTVIALCGPMPDDPGGMRIVELTNGKYMVQAHHGLAGWRNSLTWAVDSVEEARNRLEFNKNYWIELNAKKQTKRIVEVR